MSAWELTNIIIRLVLPPGVLIILGLLGAALARSRVRYGVGLALFSLIALYALSMPVVGFGLLRSLQPPYIDPVNDPNPGAIVILTGGVLPESLEYGGLDTLSGASLERARYGALVQRRTGKPILVTGGNPAGHALSEAEAMKIALQELGANVKWVEGQSNNTFDSARLSAAMLRDAGVQSVYLVTHAWHLPRARMAFERVGLHVVPAGTGYSNTAAERGRSHVLGFVPNAYSMYATYLFFHEVLGLLWYRLRFDLAS